MKRHSTTAGLLPVYLAVLVLATAALTYLIVEGIYALTIAAAAAIVFSLVKIIAIHHNYTRRVTFMFNAVENDDFTFRFNETGKDSDDILINMALNRIKEILSDAKVRAREREKYYELIMDCAKTGFITIDGAGNVHQSNSEALRIFGLVRLTHINQLLPISEELVAALREIQSGDKPHIRYINETGEMNLSLTCSDIRLDGRPVRVITVSDIDNELSEREIQSWNKLTRILTHEIMNSLAPVTSLSQTLIELNDSQDENMARGLETIADTSRRLLAFVESFRRFTRIPQPIKRPFEIAGMIHRAAALIGSDSQTQIIVSIDPPDTMIYADENLISQVIINLLKNAREAVRDCEGKVEGRIEIRSSIDADENVIIEVSNNGGAIPAETVENIFTPFFTTKQDGSGIGLSVSRQIMQLHGGSLRLSCNTPQRVTFTLRFGGGTADNS